jgi:hypothetical protein
MRHCFCRSFSLCLFLLSLLPCCFCSLLLADLLSLASVFLCSRSALLLLTAALCCFSFCCTL